MIAVLSVELNSFAFIGDTIGSDDSLFTPSLPSNGELSAYAGGYFAFEMYVPVTGFRPSTSSNNWLIVVPGNNNFNNNSRLNLNHTSGANSAAGTWVTLYIQIQNQNGFNMPWKNDVNRLASSMQWDNSAAGQDKFIRNAYFQTSSLGIPSSSQPTILAFDISSKTATAIAPANGQAVEFAYSINDNIPTSSWVAGTLNGNSYSVIFVSTPAENIYYIFARSVQNNVYDFVGTSTRIIVTTIIPPTIKPEQLQSFEATEKIVSGTINEGTITFTWVNPNPNKSKITYYEFYRTGTGTSWITDPFVINAADTIVEGGITKITISLETLEITKKGSYDFRVKAGNDEGLAAYVYLGGPLSTDLTRYRVNVTIPVN